MKSLRALGSLVLLASSLSAAAVGDDGRGEITVDPAGPVDELMVAYRIYGFMGEPVIDGTYRWKSATLLKLDLANVVWLAVENQLGKAYIPISGTVPEPGVFNFNTPGSPAWDKVLAKTWTGATATAFMSEKDAKAFWRAGFKVVDAQLSHPGK